MAVVQQGTRKTQQERVNEIVSELRKRGLHDDRCPRCHTTNWDCNFVHIPLAPLTMGLQPITGYVPTASAFVPVVLFTCLNCGYLIYHNLNVLETK